jgi:hypothetical protein
MGGFGGAEQGGQIEITDALDCQVSRRICGDARGVERVMSPAREDGRQPDISSLRFPYFPIILINGRA